MPQLSIRSMQLEDLQLAFKWAIEEGWNIGKYDAEPYLEQDLEGYKLLLLDDKPIGAISIVSYGQSFAFIGLFIICKEYRGNGYGTYLWNAVLKELTARLDHNASVGLYAVPKQISRYKSSDFRSMFGIQRWETKAPANRSAELNSNLLSINASNFFDQVVKYDKEIFSASRERFLKKLLKMPGVNAFIMVENNAVCGYGIIRCCQEGFRIGPLYANSFKNAQVLAETLLNTVATTDSTIIFDSPDIQINKYIISLAEYFNLKRIPNGDTELMIKGNLPQAMIDNANKNYAIASLELG